MNSTALQKPSSTKRARAPGIILPGNGWRAPDTRAIELTKFFLDSVELLQKNLSKEGISPFEREYSPSFLEMSSAASRCKSLPFEAPSQYLYELDNLLDSLFSGKGQKYRFLPQHERTMFSDMRESLRAAFREIMWHVNCAVFDVFDASQYRIWRHDEFNYNAVVMSLPTYLDWADPINNVEAEGVKPDRFLAVMEHILFIQALVSQGLYVLLLRPRPDCPEMVYTRDVMGVLGDKVLRGNMVAAIRQREHALIQNAIIPPSEVQLEYGNYFIDKEKGIILLGIGDRTNMEAAEWLQSLAGTDYNVLPFRLKNGVLHKDCAWSRIANFLFPGAYENPKDIELLIKLYGTPTFITGRQARGLFGNLVSIPSRSRHEPANFIVPLKFFDLSDPQVYVHDNDEAPNNSLPAPNDHRGIPLLRGRISFKGSDILMEGLDPVSTKPVVSDFGTVPLYYRIRGSRTPVPVTQLPLAEGSFRCATAPIL